MGYSPWGRKELNMTEQFQFLFFSLCFIFGSIPCSLCNVLLCLLHLKESFLMFNFSETKITTPAFFWLPFTWNIIFHTFTFSLYVSLGLKWVSCQQHIYGSCFCIHSVSLYLLVAAFNPFIFKVIIDTYVPIGIFSIVFFVFVGLSFLLYLLAI